MLIISPSVSDRDAVMQYYMDGLKPEQVKRRLHHRDIETSFIRDIYRELDVSKARAKSEIDKMKSFSLIVPEGKPKEESFVLLTENKQVKDAWNKLQKGWKQ